MQVIGLRKGVLCLVVSWWNGAMGNFMRTKLEHQTPPSSRICFFTSNSTRWKQQTEAPGFDAEMLLTSERIKKQHLIHF